MIKIAEIDYDARIIALFKRAREEALFDVYVPKCFNPKGIYTSGHQFVHASEIKQEVQKVVNCLNYIISTKTN